MRCCNVHIHAHVARNVSRFDSVNVACPTCAHCSNVHTRRVYLCMLRQRTHVFIAATHTCRIPHFFGHACVCALQQRLYNGGRINLHIIYSIFLSYVCPHHSSSRKLGSSTTNTSRVLLLALLLIITLLG